MRVHFLKMFMAYGTRYGRRDKDQIETINYLINGCSRALEAKSVLDRIKIASSYNPFTNQNLTSLTQHLYKENDSFNLEIIEHRLQTSLKDLEFIKKAHANPKIIVDI
jgi:hypothetical protein